MPIPAAPGGTENLRFRGPYIAALFDRQYRLRPPKAARPALPEGTCAQLRKARRAVGGLVPS